MISLKGQKMGKPHQNLERKKAVYDYIIYHKQEHDGNSPTIRELCNATEITSTMIMRNYIGYLVEDGLLERDPEVSRGIRVVGGQWKLRNTETRLQIKVVSGTSWTLVDTGDLQNANE